MVEQLTPPATVCDDQILKVRLEAISQAQRRSRIAFLASTIISLAIIITMWNAYGSWYRTFLFKDKLADNEMTKEIQKSFVDEWVRSLKISIPVLGIQAGVGDAAVLGSLSLYITCIWLYFSMRRENHSIGLLLRDTKGCSPPTRSMVFHGIISFGIFTTVTEIDEPIKGLHEELSKPSPSPPRGIVRFTYKALIFLPAVTILVTLLMDVVTIFWMSSPVREEHTSALWHVLSQGDLIKRLLMGLFGFSLFFLTSALCFRINKYSYCTESLLREYQALPQSEC